MNDLISREALKKALKSNCDLCHDKNTNWCEHCCPLNDFEDLIDNAPTVEPDKVLVANVTFDEDKLKDIVQTEVIEKIKSGELVIKDERPQNEYFDMSKLRLMTVEECAGHTIEYAMGWKACIDWLKKGGADNEHL